MLARSRLDPLVRQKMDPEDVMQSVFKSFFWRQAEGQWDLGNWDSLWSVLALLTVRKCCRWAGYYRGLGRDVRRETSPHREDDSSASWEFLDREPTPDEAAALVETVERVMRGLEGYHRDIFQMSLQGFGPAEISVQAGVSERSVQRVLKRVRERLADMAEGE